MPLPILIAKIAIKVAIKLVKVLKAAKAAKALKAAGTVVKKAGKAKIGAKKVASKKAVKAKAKKAKGKGKKKVKSKPKENPFQKCTKKGHPVDAIHGYVYYNFTDFEYPGVIPFTWERSWNSGNVNPGAFGHGSGSLYTMSIRREDEDIVFINEEGREIYFDLMRVVETVVNRGEQLSLTSGVGKYEIFNHETRLWYVFEGKAGGKAYRLARIENEPRDHKIVVQYDSESRLSGITDTAGRHFEIKTNKTGQVTKVKYDGRVLATYAYDSLLNLIEDTDVNGVKSTLYYKKHLLVKHTLKDGHTFRWEYDGEDENARCKYMWSDNGLLEGWFEYHDSHTVFTNSLGHKEVFHFDREKLLTKYIDANKAETQYTYSRHGEIESVMEPDGEITKFAYNDYGQVTEVTLPNGAVQTSEYDENSRHVKSVAPNGAEITWEYDDSGRMTRIVMPTGGETVYEYNEDGMVSKIIEGEGENERLTEIEYDGRFNLHKLKYPNGSLEQRDYDEHGNCVKSLNPLGAVQKMEYDQANRLVKLTEDDGNVTALEYNAYDDVIRLKENDREISYTYTPLGEVATRKEQNRIIKMNYDTEGWLANVENEAGERYIYERDNMGNVVTETGYDGVQKSYSYSPGGKLTGMKRGKASGFAEIEYDSDGQLAKIIYDNGDTEVFAHGKIGELLAAENKNAKLTFEYDVMGNVIKEAQNGQVVESVYSAGYAERTKLTTSFGLNVDMRLNRSNQAEEIAAAFQGGAVYQCSLAYNVIGQIAERGASISGGGRIKDSWRYDSLGRPVSQSLNINSRESRRRQYSWEPGDKLKSVIDIVGRIGLEYSYDSFGVPEAELIKGAKYPSDRQKVIRHLDDTGNVYETRDKVDRKYGSGGQLITAKGNEYQYNDCGDLIEKKEPDGKMWRYSYHPSGLLEKVVRPDGKDVLFAYDPLGRRVSKEFDGKTTKFLWDGDKTVHEWVEESSAGYGEQPAKLSAWLFDEGSFTPFAKFIDGQALTIISNHLGVPNTMLDQDGKIMWSAEYDIYGKLVIKEGGDSDELNCPFRFPGQYEDVETGLYYNRFRYYDPEVGQYIQQDHIGLEGNNPTLYGYVNDPNLEFDLFGLSPLRAALTKAGQQLAGTWQAHHLIPNQVWKANSSFFKAVGFTGQHSVANGIALPSSGHSGYSAAHRNYNARIEKKVNRIRRDYNAGKQDAAAKKKASDALKRVQNKARKDIQNGKVRCK